MVFPSTSSSLLLLLVLVLAMATNTVWANDISATGKCQAEIAGSPCKDVVGDGPGKVAYCLRSEIRKQHANVKGESALLPNAQKSPAAAAATTFSDDCIAEVKDFVKSAKIDDNAPILSACDAEIAEGGICDVVNAPTPPENIPLSPEELSSRWQVHCLRKKGVLGPGSEKGLSPKCYSKVVLQQNEESLDVDLSASISEACSAELTDSSNTVYKKCGNLPAGKGKKVQCLEIMSKALSPKCKKEIFKKEVDDSADLRNSNVLMLSCKSELSSFCEGISVDREADKALDCLFKSRENPDFSRQCKGSIVWKMAERNKDYRLDSGITQHCEEDITNLCSTPRENGEDYSGKVLQCLKFKFTKISNSKCKNRVRQSARVASEGFQMDQAVHESCKPDALIMCCDNDENKCESKNSDGEVENAGIDILKCLKKNYDFLANPCQHNLLLAAKVESNNIEMKPAMKRACRDLIKSECLIVDHKRPDGDDARIIECLQDHKSDAGVSEFCVKELQEDLELTSKDYRLKFGINDECQSDMNELCKDELDSVDKDSLAHGGVVLDCMVKNRKEIKELGCKKQVKRFQKSVIDNWKNSVQVKSACSEDVNTYCANVEAGHGRVHSCLLKHLEHQSDETGENALSEACAEEEFSILKQKVEDVSINIDVAKPCAVELKRWCPEKMNGEGGGLACLEDKLNDDDMGAKCKQKVEVFVRAQNMDYRLNPGLAKYCKNDIEKTCSYEKMTREKMGHNVLDCLVKNRSELTESNCKAEVRRINAQRSNDASVAPVVAKNCDSDIKNFCSDVKSGFGKVHACLFSHMSELTPACKDAEFKQQVIKSEDISFNPLLFKACRTDTKRWCEDTEKGQTVSCLASHLDDADMSSSCKQLVQKENVKKGKSWEFNMNIKKHCVTTIFDFKKLGLKGCEKAGLAKTDLEGDNLSCLSKNQAKIKDTSCKAAVFKKEKVNNLAVANVHGNKAACVNDMDTFCSGVDSSGSAMFMCLVDNLSKLSKNCQEKVNDRKTFLETDIELNPLVNKKCKNEKKLFCRDIEHGDSRVLSCLSTNSAKPGFSQKCNSELKRLHIPQIVSYQNANADSLVASSNSGGVLGSLVISGPLAMMSLAALFFVGLGAAYFGWRRNAQSKGNYKLVLPGDMRNGKSRGEML